MGNELIWLAFALLVLALLVTFFVITERAHRRMSDLERQLDITNQKLLMLAKQQGYDFWHDGLHPPCWERRYVKPPAKLSEIGLV